MSLVHPFRASSITISHDEIKYLVSKIKVDHYIKEIFRYFLSDVYQHLILVYLLLTKLEKF